MTIVMKRAVVVLAVLLLLVTACDTKDLVLSPKDGAIVAEDHVTVTGHLPQYAKKGGTLVVNGTTGAIGSDGTWSGRSRSSTTSYVSRRARSTPTPTARSGVSARPSCTGRSSTRASTPPTASGCASPTPAWPASARSIKSLAAGAFDIGGLLLSQNPIIDAAGRRSSALDITGNAYEAGVGRWT